MAVTDAEAEKVGVALLEGDALGDTLGDVDAEVVADADPDAL